MNKCHGFRPEHIEDKVTSDTQCWSGEIEVFLGWDLFVSVDKFRRPGVFVADSK